MELNLSGIEDLNSTIPEQLNNSSLNNPDELDLSGIDKLPIPKKSTIKKSSREVFQPNSSNANWEVSKFPNIQNWYQETFGTNIPAQIGQKAIHNKWNYDHRNSVDVNLNPSSKEGQALIAHLKENNTPYLAFNHAIPGVATGPHIHIGFPSHKTGQKFAIGTTLSSQQKEENQELNLDGIDSLLENNKEEALPSNNIDLDLSGIEDKSLEASLHDLTPNPIDPSLAIDPSKLDFKRGTQQEYALAKAGFFRKPTVLPSSVFDVGDAISTEINIPEKVNLKNPKSVAKVSDAWLAAWNPKYAELNKKFREETGGLSIALVDNPANVKALGDGRYKIISRPTKSIQALMEAYEKNGMAGFNATTNLINRQADQEQLDIKQQKENLDVIYRKHPYLGAINSAYQDEVLAWLNLSRNTKGLAKALWIGNTKGYDSQEYLDAVNQEDNEISQMEELQSSVYQPPTILGKILKGYAGGVLALPRFAAFGRTPIGLPLMTYVEELHRGNRAAATSALPMAIMVGTSHGLGEFLNAGTAVEREALSITNKGEADVTRQFGEIDQGAGNIAPFKSVPRVPGTFTREDLSLFTKQLAKGKSISIGQLSPLSRQLLLRGTNALSMGAASLVQNSHQGLSDIVTTLTVGFGLPVGKGPETAYLGEDYVPPPILPKKVLQLGEAPRIPVPITQAPNYGKLPILESERGIPPVIYPSAESPNTAKYGESFDPTKYISETEKGFQARGQGETVHLDMDTAALNLLDLRRTWESGAVNDKNLSLKENLGRQKAVQDAITQLESVLPKEVIDFFEKNEDVIRAALKTNGGIKQAKENFLNRVPESVQPHEIEPNQPLSDDPIIRAKQEEVNKKLGNMGLYNVYTNREKAAEKFDKFFNITGQGTFQSSLFGLDVLARKSADAAYMGAFVIEDLYKRGIEPTVDLLLNKLRTSLGDYGKTLTDDHAKFIFNKGMEYYQSNNADPFFSKMKQDALEKLPIRFTEGQARSILSQHKNEFEWTAGLDEFLRENEGKRINKNELIDVIQKGQVRVEASVASDEINPVEKQLDELASARQEASRNNNQDLAAQITKQMSDLQSQRTQKPKYSIKAYTGEKLELPGAINSKEVKLIYPLKRTALTKQVEYEKYLEEKYNLDFTIRGEFNKLHDNSTITPEELSNLVDLREANVEQSKTLYNAPHWDEPNVVAHYRSNDRTTTDNIPIHFSEEFQSDWNHDIREYGLKAEQRPNTTVQTKGAIEPNPFMSHAWKELVFKRFLRDAVVAKDENGNNKYEGIGWTTARQQQERYGKVLEGKDFKWIKNSDGTYSFGFKNANGNPMGFDADRYDSPHELSNISLERFTELTTKEAAEEVRSQENAPKFAIRKPSGEVVRYSVDEQKAINIAEQLDNELEYKSKHTVNKEVIESGKFSLKEAVELRSGIGKYSDYDVAMVNYAKKIGKRFGASYSQKEIPIDKDLELVGEPTTEPAIIAKEKVHFLEITPSMRESLSKEGFPLYGTGGEEPLTNTETGIRNRITTQEGFDEHRNNLVNLLKNVVTLYHGTQKPYRTLNSPGDWTYYTNNPEYANARTNSFGESPVVYKQNIHVENPLDIRELGFNNVHPEDLIEKLQQAGLDITLNDITKGYPSYRSHLSSFIHFDNEVKAKIRSEAIKAGYDSLLTHDIIYNNDKDIAGDSYILFDPIPADAGTNQDFLGLMDQFKNKNKKLFDKYNRVGREMDDAFEAVQEDRTDLNAARLYEQKRKEYLKTFDELRKIQKESGIPQSSHGGTVFNSGLSLDAFIDQTKLLYSGIKDFATFSKEVIKRFGEQVTPFLQDLWIQVKGLAKATTERVDDFLDYSEGKNTSKNFREGGFFRNAPDAEKNYKIKKKKTPVFGWYSIWRGVGLAQLTPEAGEVYDVMRGGQRVKNAFESNVLFKLRDANDKVKGGLDQEVADNIWIGNEKGSTWTDAELAAGDAGIGRPALNPAQIAAYRDVRSAMNINLDIRKETKLYSMRERARRLNDQLAAATAGTPEWDSIATKLLDLSDSMKAVDDHFSKLKKEGYISTKRQGKIVAYIEDAAGKLYQHFDSLKEAGNWINEQIINGTNPATQEIYDVKVPAKLRKAAANLTPGQFEDLIDSAGVNPHSPDVETIRNEVYAKFPSFGYELKRDFVRGYDRNWQFVLESIAHQTETYANSFYSRVAGEEGIKKLDALGVQAIDERMYETLQKFIDHEISSPERSSASQVFGGIRKGVYLFQLGFDINQLYLNAIAQPISQTYSYFSRVEHNGIKLTGNEINSYFLRGGKLAGMIAKRNITGNGLIPADFDTIYNRLQQEKVIEPEFNRSLLEMETENTVSGKLQRTIGTKAKRFGKGSEHWAGIFMRNGEKATRTHVAAEAYLVGKEKFNLVGEDLVTFIVRAVDATQTNPSRAEAPLVVRGSQNDKEFRKLLYQFNAFNHMWLENLALNVRSDLLKDQFGGFKKGNLKFSARSTSRHLGPLILMGGIKGLPLAGFSSNLYTLITGDDPKKHFDKLLGDDTYLERAALYGVTTNAALSNRLTPGVPIVDNIKIQNTVGESVDETFSATNMIPAFATAAQLGRGFQDFYKENWLRAASELLPIKPLRNIATAVRYQREGIRTRGDEKIESRKKVTIPQTIGQVIGLQPTPVIEYYEKKKTEKLQKIATSSPSVRRLRRKLKRIF